MVIRAHEPDFLLIVVTLQAIEDLRASGDAATLKEGSWEEKMAAECRTRLAVRPRAGRAVLFYSQHPDGREDKESRHGGCPVLADGKAKWAANLCMCWWLHCAFLHIDPNVLFNPC